MKMIIGNQLRTQCVIVASFLCSIVMMSSTSKPGGDSFTIYLNDKLLVEQFVLRKETPKTISLAAASKNDVVRVYYSHCGKIGVARTLIIKDAEGKKLASWNFKNSEANKENRMAVNVNEILSLRTALHNQRLQLVYTSKELPDGMPLAYLALDLTKASIK
jgi:hypothetical protein